MRLLTALLLTAIAGGCAHTSGQDQVSRLQQRVDRVEQRLEQQDQYLRKARADLSIVSDRAYEFEEVRSEGSIVSKTTVLTTREIQSALRKAGFYKGKVDGVAGAQTDKGIKEFQRNKGLKVDGKVGKETSRYLSAYLD